MITSTGDLFRREAVAHSFERTCGTVLLAQPKSSFVLTAIFSSVALTVVAFFACATYTRKAHVPGVLVPSDGIIRVSPMQTGVIAERRAHDGQTVRTGDVLFVLTSERTSPTQGEVNRTISSLLQSRRHSVREEETQQRAQSSERIATARRHVEMLVTDLERVEQQIALQERRVALAEEAVERLTELQASHFVSASQVQERQAESIDQHQHLYDLQRVRAADTRDLAAARGDIHDLQLQEQRDHEAAERTITDLEQDLIENEAQRALLVRAPHDGTVTAITVTPGQPVSSDQTLASIIPDGSPLEADLYAPTRAVGFIQSGMAVVLHYPAFPYQKFGQFRGIVAEVSRTTMRSDESTLLGVPLPGSGDEPLYRIRVRLERQSVSAYGREQPLRSGMALDASILLEKRHLYEWVLDPAFSVAGRL
jgi:membrane fusion protein